ncbi:sporulation-delaying protein SdpB family protein [Aureibacter tunicatorum]|uniref:Antimicrobial peptide system SdpB family protein n=1 Tax=Aureibacter tunicatorum TaxID=866807 RepID=A0AAE3XGN4_9BACT|nr:sporulation-delaying protein SdpB family protein [Aureibacter tunicatorum]MDR6237276.1 antimicrobial peptide system SdpB family protein [Aureibacter tunicatorum]BDD06268.1 sporulation-delaying protein SdpB [Aureibacter tunicatorum]
MDNIANLPHRILSIFESISSKNPFTNVYGLGRSVLALGMFLTLLFNEKEILFPQHLFHANIADSRFIESTNLFFIFGLEHYWASLLISSIILLSVISGYFPRITGILHWWVTFSFFKSAAIIEGGDQIAATITLLLIPITLLDNRKNHWNKIEHKSNPFSNYIAYIFFLFIKIQVAIIYLHAGIDKLYKVQEWVDGTAVYYWFNNSIFGLSDALSGGWLEHSLNNALVVQSISWGAIAFEILLFGTLFMSFNKKKYFLFFGILFHFGIMLVHGLVTFYMTMTCALILYILPPEMIINAKLPDFKSKWTTLLSYFKRSLPANDKSYAQTQAYHTIRH